LIMHILMIEWLITENKHYNEYDFLAGDARYKSSLSTVKDEYLKLTLQRNSIKFLIENKLRKVYQNLIK
jgi:CelD/BcsL family acetyltransferase involved in cellulose biosynthesis